LRNAAAIFDLDSACIAPGSPTSVNPLADFCEKFE
jgi:hypothetical protein